MNYLKLATDVFNEEITSILSAKSKLGNSFTRAIDLISNCRGRVVVVGMGKSGIIGKKIAATLASTGTSSFFVHPAEAFHGDLGMIQPADVLLMISNSGETEELIRLIPFLLHQGNLIIAMTGNLHSSLAKNSYAVLDVSVEREACNNNLAPTSSTTVSLVMGDALSIVLSTLKNFKIEDFARFHPGGRLGRRLLTRVCDVMHKENLPICAFDAPFREVVSVITRGKLGVALVMNSDQMLGIITDGDLRKVFESFDNPLKLLAADFMTVNPLTIELNETLAAAENKMKENSKRVLIAVDGKKPLGVLQIFDIES